jgi:hypothetical protein
MSIKNVRMQACACRDDACRDRSDIDLADVRKRFRHSSTAANDCLVEWEPTASVDEVLAHMREVRDTVCACRDADCVEEAEMSSIYWEAKNMKNSKSFKFTNAQNEIWSRINDETEACKRRITDTAGRF